MTETEQSKNTILDLGRVDDSSTKNYKVGLKLPVGALGWPVFPLRGRCASTHISFSFVSVLLLVRDWDSRQRERRALLAMLVPRSRRVSARMLWRSCLLSRLPGQGLWLRCRSRWCPRTSPCLFPRQFPHVASQSPPPYVLFWTVSFLPELAWATTLLPRTKELSMQQRGAGQLAGR